MVDRDRLRANFLCTKFFDLKVELSKTDSKKIFSANLFKLDGKKIATSNDFNSQTGEIKTNDVTLLSENQAHWRLFQKQFLCNNLNLVLTQN